MKRLYFVLVLFAFSAMGTKATGKSKKGDDTKVLPDSIIVTADRFGLTPKNSVWPTELIKHQTLAQSVDMKSALDGKDGLDVRNYNGYGSISTLSNWGVFNRHMLLLYNGRVVKDYSLGGFNLSDYSLDEFHRIEILKGPQSAFYGADAIGGVVNLITLSPLIDRLQLTARQGSFNFSQYHFDFSKKVGNFGFGGFAEYGQTDNKRDNSGSERFLFNLKTGYLSADNRHKLSLSARYFNDSLGVPGPQPSKSYIPVYGNAESYSLYDYQEDEDYSIDFQYHFVDKKLGTAQLDIFWEKKNLDYHSLYNYKFNYYTYDSTVNPIDSGLNTDSVDVHSRSIYNKRSSGLSARYMNHISFFQYAGGIDWLSGSIRSTSDDKSDATNIVGPFSPYTYDYGSYNYWKGVQSQYDLWSDIIMETNNYLRFDISGRLQLMKNRKTQPSYNLGMIISPLSTTEFKIGYGYAFRLPTISERFAENVFTAGNDKLNPETSRSIIGSIRFNSDDKKIQARATFFYQTIDSLIQYQFDMASFKYTPRNVEKFKSDGVDLSFKYRFSPNLSFSWGGVAQNARQTIKAGKDYVDAFYVPDFKWRVDVFGYYRQINYNFNVCYTSKRSLLFGDNEKYIDHGYDIGFALGYDFLKNFSLMFTGNDLADQKRPDQFGFSLQDNDYPSLGRRFFVTAKYSLF